MGPCTRAIDRDDNATGKEVGDAARMDATGGPVCHGDGRPPGDGGAGERRGRRSGIQPTGPALPARGWTVDERVNSPAGLAIVPTTLRRVEWQRPAFGRLLGRVVRQCPATGRFLDRIVSSRLLLRWVAGDPRPVQ